MKKLIILSSTNGAGLSTSRYVFEELGYFIIENVPSALIKNLLEELNKEKKINNVLLITSIEEAKTVKETAVQNSDFHVSLFVLSATKEVLLKRFALTRHTHPRTIGSKLTLEQAIDLDLKSVDAIIDDTDCLLDTSNMEVKDLRNNLYHILSEKTDNPTITFISYGIKNGVPKGLDTSFDVRIIPNPFWVEELKQLNGADQKVIDYMLSFPVTMETINHIISYLDFYLPKLLIKDRANYNIGVACSGGHHRSTFVANYLADHYKDKYNTLAIHRDCPSINKNGK